MTSNHVAKSFLASLFVQNATAIIHRASTLQCYLALLHLRTLRDVLITFKNFRESDDRDYCAFEIWRTHASNGGHIPSSVLPVFTLSFFYNPAPRRLGESAHLCIHTFASTHLRAYAPTSRRTYTPTCLRAFASRSLDA